MPPRGPRPRLSQAVLLYTDLRLHTASSGPVEGLESLYLTLDYDGLVGAAELRVNVAYLTGVSTEAQRRCVHEAVAAFPFGPDPAADRAALDAFDFDAPTRALLDCALADAAARMRGQSVAALLGGPAGPPSHATNQTLFRDAPERVVARAKAYAARGFTQLKLRIGFGDPAEDLALLRALREALGPDARLSADVNGAWSLTQAEALLAPLAEVGLDYLEQPTAPDRLDDAAALARRAPFPIMLDESAGGPAAVARACEIESPLLLHLKLVKIGGLDRLTDAVRLARGAGHDVMIGQMNEGALATAAALSAAAALGPRFAELYGADGLVNDPADGLTYGDGRVTAADATGIGAALVGDTAPLTATEMAL